MIDDAIFEIGELIHVRYSVGITFRRLTPVEIVNTFEYKIFRQKFPVLCKFAEGGML